MVMFQERVLTFIRQLNLESGHPALIPTPTPVRSAQQNHEILEIFPRTDESRSPTESHKESSAYNGSP